MKSRDSSRALPLQSRSAQVFSDLDGLGEEEDNNFWIRRVGEPTVEKLVLRVEAPARDVVRFLRALLLADADTPFVGAKLYVGIEDVLCVAYVRPGAEVTELLLRDLCEACGSQPFRPYHRSVDKPHRVWVGRSDEASSLCHPLY